jgi:hypothetical protein
MAILTMTNTSYEVVGKKITVNYTTNVILTNIQLSKDGTNFINPISFSTTSAMFDVSSWDNGIYSNCVLRGHYDASSIVETYGEIVISTDSLTIQENGSAYFSIILDKAPTSNQIVNIASQNTGIATVDKSSLTFTPSNYQIEQIVNIYGVHNANDYNDKSTNIVLSSNEVTSKTISVTVLNIDSGNKIGDIITSTSTLGLYEDDTVYFVFILSAQPTSNETISISTSDVNIARVDKSSVTISSDNYQSEQQIMVTGIQDGLSTATRECTITLSSPNFNSTSITVTVYNSDSSSSGGDNSSTFVLDASGYISNNDIVANDYYVTSNGFIDLTTYKSSGSSLLLTMDNSNYIFEDVLCYDENQTLQKYEKVSSSTVTISSSDIQTYYYARVVVKTADNSAIAPPVTINLKAN